MNKEQIYDEQVNPLLMQIIDICEKNGIAMLASFAIPTQENDDLRCTTCLPDGSGNNPPDHSAALKRLVDTETLVSFTVSDADAATVKVDS